MPLLDAAGPVHDDVIVSVGAVHGEQQVPLTVPSEEEPLCHPECYAGLGGSHVCVYASDDIEDGSAVPSESVLHGGVRVADIGT